MLSMHYLGNSFFKIEDKKCVVYIDPYYVPEKKVWNKKKPCIVLVSHEHPENFSKKFIVKISKKKNSLVCCNAHLSTMLENIPVYKKRLLKTNIKVNIFGVSVKPISVHHPNSFNPWGFEITIDSKKLFHTGDTFLSKAFNETKANILILPIEGKNTMDVVDAVKAVKTMKPDYVIPMRFSHLKTADLLLEEFSEKLKKSILKTKPLILRQGEQIKI